ncbi:MAG: hypothetical protein KDB26_07805 [Microthrixaceae bacterium]|nr:hypothetical protein [Microthrixaceae bacterium]
MTLQKYPLDDDASDAFVFVDLDEADVATGIVRSAKKVLQDGARSLARHETYAWALLKTKFSGASGGINTPPDQQGVAYEQFTRALAASEANRKLILRPGKGVPPAEDSTLNDLTAQGVVAATRAALGGLDGRSVAVESGDAAAQRVSELLTESGVTVSTVTPAEFESTPSQALICGSKVGLIDHEMAARLPHDVIVPMGPSPVTARAFAVLTKKNVTVIPAFLSVCGPLFAHRAQVEMPNAGPDIETLCTQVDEFVTARSEELSQHPEGSYMGACFAAEEFLATWIEELPFGRPFG